jgi:HEAT repeats
MLARSQGGEVEVSETVLEPILNNAAGLDLGTKGKGKRQPAAATGPHAETRRELLVIARGLFRHEDPRIRTAAVHVLGQFDDTDAIDLARQRMLDRDEDLRVRRESANTLTRLAGEAAIDDLIKLADDNDMTTFAVRNLRSIGTAEVLRKVQKEHYNGYLRREAGKAADAIEKKLGRKKRG